MEKTSKNVIILDKERIGYGQTALSTGHLTYALDDRYFELERLFGLKGSILAGQSHKWAVDEIGRISKQESIDSEFEILDGFLFAASEHDRMELYDEEAACHRAGLMDVIMEHRSALERSYAGMRQKKHGIALLMGRGSIAKVKSSTVPPVAILH